MTSANKIVFVLFLVTGISLSSFGQEKSAVKWKEKENFHAVMAATFHPSEEGNFKPIRERAGELAEKALAWKKSVFPKEFDKPEIRKTMDELVAGSNEISAMVKKNATDEELGKKISALHEVFHKIIGLCEHGK
jgi:hypothetical protein